MIQNIIENLKRSDRPHKDEAIKLLGVTQNLIGGDLPLRPEAKVGVFQQEWETQANRLADLFAEELGLSKEQYIKSLPQFGPQPESYKGRFDIPVLVETRMELPRMLKIAGMTSYFDVSQVADWAEGKFETPKAPYATWLADGSSHLGEDARSVDTVRIELARDERGGTVFDGVALVIKNPDILMHHHLDLPGSQVGSDCAPYLNRWSRGPRLHYGRVDDADPRYGSVVAGRNLVLGSES